MRDPVLDPILIDPVGANKQWENACKQVLESDFESWETIWKIDWETGNPIYSLCNLASNKAIRVIQNERTVPYGIYMDKAPRLDTFENIVDELVFCCSLSESTLSVFMVVFRVWTRPQTTAAYMKDLLARCSLWKLEP